MIHNPNPTLATYAKQDGVHLRIAAKAESRDAANSMIADFEEKVRALTNHWVYGIDDETLSAAIGKLLVKQRRKVATMESASGGLLVHKSTHHFDLLNWCQEDGSTTFGQCFEKHLAARQSRVLQGEA